MIPSLLRTGVSIRKILSRPGPVAASGRHMSFSAGFQDALAAVAPHGTVSMSSDVDGLNIHLSPYYKSGACVVYSPGGVSPLEAREGGAVENECGPLDISVEKGPNGGVSLSVSSGAAAGTSVEGTLFVGLPEVFHLDVTTDEQVGGQIRIARGPWSNGFEGNAKIFRNAGDVYIEKIKGGDLVVECHDGDISADDIQSKSRLATLQGAVGLKKVRTGALFVDARKVDVGVMYVNEGGVKAHGPEGVRIKALNGSKIRLESEANVDVVDAEGSLDISAVGDVSVQMNGAYGGDSSFTSRDGNVILTVPGPIYPLIEPPALKSIEDRHGESPRWVASSVEIDDELVAAGEPYTRGFGRVGVEDENPCRLRISAEEGHARIGLGRWAAAFAEMGTRKSLAD